MNRRQIAIGLEGALVNQIEAALDEAYYDGALQESKEEKAYFREICDHMVKMRMAMVDFVRRCRVDIPEEEFEKWYAAHPILEVECRSVRDVYMFKEN